MSQRPTILFVNDDGIQSHFLLNLVQAFSKDFNCFIAAPLKEQSWKSKSMSCEGGVKSEPWKNAPCPAWAISGTPADCVNIAIHHLLPKKPDLVISGINIGMNLGLDMLSCSGTLAGALEACLHGIPALALSHAIAQGCYKELKASFGLPPTQELKESLNTAIEYCYHHAKAVLETPLKKGELHCINFPYPTLPTTPTNITHPAFTGGLNLFSLDAKIDPRKQACVFDFPPLSIPLTQDAGSDLESIKEQAISLSILNYLKLSTHQDSPS